MDTALTAAGPTSAPSRPIRHGTLAHRISRSAGFALVAWSRGAQRSSREDLAELHERRREAERLREELFRDVTLSRLM